MSHYIDPNEYRKWKNRGKVTITRVDTDLLNITIAKKDDNGDPMPVTYLVSTAYVTEVLANTVQEKNRLQDLLTDIQAVV